MKAQYLKKLKGTENIRKTVSFFEKAESYFRKLESFFEKIESFFEEAESFFEEAESFLEEAESFFEEAESFFEEVETFFEEAESFFEICWEFWKTESSLLAQKYLVIQAKVIWTDLRIPHLLYIWKVEHFQLIYFIWRVHVPIIWKKV